MKRSIKTLFLPPTIAMVVFAALGLLLLFVPGFFVRILPPLVGIVLIIVGLSGVVSGFTLRGATSHPIFIIGPGLLAIVVGIIFLAKNDVSVVFISILFGLYVILSAVFSIMDAWRKRKAGQPWVFDIVEGVIDILLGLILLLSPLHGMNLWVRILGAHFILIAIGALLMLARVKKQFLALLPSGEAGGNHEDKEPDEPPDFTKEG